MLPKIIHQRFKSIEFPEQSFLLPLLIVSLVFIFVYFAPVLLIFDNPFSYHPLQGILILAISAYMAWTKRETLLNLQISPNIIVGTLISLLSLLILMVGKRSMTPLLEGLSLPIGVLGLCWLLLGSGYVKVLFLSIAYLVFLFPLFDKLLASFSPYFEHISALIGYHILKMCGISVFQHDNYIELPHITLEVVQACNGVNHIVALMALTLFINNQIRFTRTRQLLMMLFALLIAILANGLRIALIGIWAKYFDSASFHGPFNMFYSSFIFVFGVFAVILFAMILAYPKSEKRNEGNYVYSSKPAISNKSSVYFSSFVAIVLLMTAWSYQTFYNQIPVSYNKDLTGIPYRIENWHGQSVPKLDEPFEGGEFDSVLKRTYRDEFGNEIKLFIGYLSYQTENKEIHKYPVGLSYNKALTVNTDEKLLQVKSVKYRKADRLSQAYFWYDIGGRTISNRYEAKLASIIDALIKKRSNAAVIIISGKIGNEHQNADRTDILLPFIRVIMPQIQLYLSSVS